MLALILTAHGQPLNCRREKSIAYHLQKKEYGLIQGYHNEIVANVMSDIYLTIRTEDTLHQHHSIARYYTGFKFPLFGNEADAFSLTHQPCGHSC